MAVVAAPRFTAEPGTEDFRRQVRKYLVHVLGTSHEPYVPQCERNKAMAHQRMIKLLFHPGMQPRNALDGFLVNWGTGMGKTRALVSILDNYFADGRPIVVMLKNKKDFLFELLRWSTRWGPFLKKHFLKRTHKPIDGAPLVPMDEWTRRAVHEHSNHLESLLSLKSQLLRPRYWRLYTQGAGDWTANGALIPSASLTIVNYNRVGGVLFTNERERDLHKIVTASKVKDYTFFQVEKWKRPDSVGGDDTGSFNPLRGIITLVDEYHNLLMPSDSPATTRMRETALRFVRTRRGGSDDTSTMLVAFTATPVSDHVLQQAAASNPASSSSSARLSVEQQSVDHALRLALSPLKRGGPWHGLVSCLTDLYPGVYPTVNSGDPFWFMPQRVVVLLSLTMLNKYQEVLRELLSNKGNGRRRASSRGESSRVVSSSSSSSPAGGLASRTAPLSLIRTMAAEEGDGSRSRSSRGTRLSPVEHRRFKMQGYCHTVAGKFHKKEDTKLADKIWDYPYKYATKLAVLARGVFRHHGPQGRTLVLTRFSAQDAFLVFRSVLNKEHLAGKLPGSACVGRLDDKFEYPHGSNDRKVCVAVARNRSDENWHAFTRFTDGASNADGSRIRVLVADAGSFGEGMSFPAIDSLVLAEVPRSWSEYQQMVGRVLRACAKPPNGRHVRIYMGVAVTGLPNLQTPDEEYYRELVAQHRLYALMKRRLADLSVDADLFSSATAAHYARAAPASQADNGVTDQWTIYPPAGRDAEYEVNPPSITGIKDLPKWVTKEVMCSFVGAPVSTTRDDLWGLVKLKNDMDGFIKTLIRYEQGKYTAAFKDVTGYKIADLALRLGLVKRVPKADRVQQTRLSSDLFVGGEGGSRDSRKQYWKQVVGEASSYADKSWSDEPESKDRAPRYPGPIGEVSEKTKKRRYTEDVVNRPLGQDLPPPPPAPPSVSSPAFAPPSSPNSRSNRSSPPPPPPPSSSGARSRSRSRSRSQAGNESRGSISETDDDEEEGDTRLALNVFRPNVRRKQRTPPAPPAVSSAVPIHHPPVRRKRRSPAVPQPASVVPPPSVSAPRGGRQVLNAGQALDRLWTKEMVRCFKRAVSGRHTSLIRGVVSMTYNALGDKAPVKAKLKSMFDYDLMNELILHETEDARHTVIGWNILVCLWRDWFTIHWAVDQPNFLKQFRESFGAFKARITPLIKGLDMNQDGYNAVRVALDIPLPPPPEIIDLT